MKNSPEDLHNHLFAQPERLSDESVKGDALKEEISRARTVSEIAGGIVENGNLVLKAKKMQGDGLIKTYPGIRSQNNGAVYLHPGDEGLYAGQLSAAAGQAGYGL